MTEISSDTLFYVNIVRITVFCCSRFLFYFEILPLCFSSCFSVPPACFFSVPSLTPPFTSSPPPVPHPVLPHVLVSSFCPRPSSSTSSSVFACISTPSSSVFVFRPPWFHPVFSLSVSSCLPLVCFLISFLEFFQVLFVFSFIWLKLAFCFPIPALLCVSAFGSSSCLTITYNKYCSCDVPISLM